MKALDWSRGPNFLKEKRYDNKMPPNRLGSKDLGTVFTCVTQLNATSVTQHCSKEN